MDRAQTVEVKAGRGIVGSTDQGGKRQVTILEREVWDELMVQLGSSLDPSIRRANVLVSGIKLANTHGQTLQIGSSRIRIYGETKPCHMMDEILPGLQDAMYPEWRGGAFGEVLDDGKIAVGDIVSWVE